MQRGRYAAKPPLRKTARRQSFSSAAPATRMQMRGEIFLERHSARAALVRAITARSLSLEHQHDRLERAL